MQTGLGPLPADFISLVYAGQLDLRQLGPASFGRAPYAPAHVNLGQMLGTRPGTHASSQTQRATCHLLQLGGHGGQALPRRAQLAAQRGGRLAVLPRGRGLARARAPGRIRQPRLVRADIKIHS